VSTDTLPTLPDAKKVAEAFGYTEEQLSSIPKGSHMGLSCGNPVATANIKEVILTHSLYPLECDVSLIESIGRNRS